MENLIRVLGFESYVSQTNLKKPFRFLQKLKKVQLLGFEKKYFYLKCNCFLFCLSIDTDLKRREAILATLNEKFSDLIKNFRISEAYNKIVNLKPYKVLSRYVYDWTYVPLKRGGIQPAPSSFGSSEPVPSTSGPSDPVPSTSSACEVPSTPRQDDVNSILTKEDENEFLHPSHR